MATFYDDLAFAGSRYDVPETAAKAIMSAAGTVLRSLLVIERVGRERDAAFDELTTRPELAELPPPGMEEREARARATAHLDQTGALRRDLADLVADAATVFCRVREGALMPVSVEPHIGHAPRPLRGLTLNAVEIMRYTVELNRWYTGILKAALREAVDGIRTLLDELPAASDENRRLRSVLDDLARRIRPPR